MTDQVATSQAEKAFIGMLNGAQPPETEKLLELFSQLEPVSVDSVIGLWRVAAFGRALLRRPPTTAAPVGTRTRNLHSLGMSDPRRSLLLRPQRRGRRSRLRTL